MTMRSAPRANSRCGVATDPGSARVARTIAGRFDEWAVADSARMVTSSAGSAKAPMVTARLDPIPPKAVPASRPGQRQQRRSHQQEVDEDEQVRAGAERRVGRDQGRDRRGHRHGGHEHHRCQREDPRRLVGTEALLAEELADVDEGLEDRRADAALEPAPHLAHGPDEHRSTDATATTWTPEAMPAPTMGEMVLIRSPPARPARARAHPTRRPGSGGRCPVAARRAACPHRRTARMTGR